MNPAPVMYKRLTSSQSEFAAFSHTIKMTISLVRCLFYHAYAQVSITTRAEAPKSSMACLRPNCNKLLNEGVGYRNYPFKLTLYVNQCK